MYSKLYKTEVYAFSKFVNNTGTFTSSQNVVDTGTYASDIMFEEICTLKFKMMFGTVFASCISNQSRLQLKPTHR